MKLIRKGNLVRFKPNESLGILFVILTTILIFTSCNTLEKQTVRFSKTTTFAGINREMGEPFGVAVDKNGTLYVSDGDAGKIIRVLSDGRIEVVTDKLDTPSGVAFDRSGMLVVADSGSQTIKGVNVLTGDVSLIAGIENKRGFGDGDAASAQFNSPIGIAIADDGKVFVADTYNDKIRIIENGKVSTLAGSSRGFSDGSATAAKFDSPCGLAILQDKSLLIADTGNRRIRRIDPTGNVITVAGNGIQDSTDNFALSAEFVAPTAIAIDESGVIYIADGNSIRAIGRRALPFVETITGVKRGFSDGIVKRSRLNRPSGLAISERGDLFIADSDNQTVRVLTANGLGSESNPDAISKLRYTAEEFRKLQKPRWTYNPPETKRDIAGTLGEIRGEITLGKEAWFHNGLDIAGSFGEKAIFIRSEKVLAPMAVENFSGLRELLRMPTIGYIHIRLGRDSNETPFDDARFQFQKNESGKLSDVRIARGTKFAAGDAIGTLNSFNHVHLIAGRSGAEMNALDALILPNDSDSIVPTIEKVSIFNQDWNPISETGNDRTRIILNGKYRVVVQAFDRMDGNPERRKLGVYRLGYQVFNDDKTAMFDANWTISFAKMPDADFVPLVYAKGSKSGYSPDTVFSYIVTNKVMGDTGSEDFFDTAQIPAGNYILRVVATDFFGNTATKDLSFQVIK